METSWKELPRGELSGRWGGSVNMAQQEARSDDCASLKHCLMAGFYKRHWKGSKFGDSKFTAFSGMYMFD
jgi:hypothetical protein